ncbi:hypothetical protein ACFL3Z_01895 [Gemmatimonadota bacterium]
MEEGESHGCLYAYPECNTHYCGHDECDKEEDDLDALVSAIETLQGPDLKRLIESDPERLLWNADRRSVQLLGCGGVIAASIILSDYQMEPFNDR